MQKAIKEEVKYLEGKLRENDDSILFARLADVYLQMDRIDEAIELCEKSIKKHPYYVTGHYVLGKCYLKKKLFDQAEKELKRVLLFDPKYISAHRDYGELMARIGWHNTCEMSYEEIIRIDPFNEQAKKRLEDLKTQPVLTREEQPDQESEMELTEFEQDIVTEVTPPPAPAPAEVPDEQPDEKVLEEFHEDVLEEELEQAPAEVTVPEDEFEQVEFDTGPADSGAPPVVKELFKETEDVFEDDEANLDLLEDIFRDDELPDLSINEDFSDQIEEDSTQNLDQDSHAVDQKYLFGEEFKTEEDEQEEFNGLEDDEIFALMSGDEEFNKPTIKSPLDISEPPRVKKQKPKIDSPVNEIREETGMETEPQFESSVEKTLEQIQRKTKPQFEPPMDKTPPKPPIEQDEPIQASEEAEMPDFDGSTRKKEKIVTSTLGEIYAAQHQYAKAIGVYEILRKNDPGNELYKQKIEYLQKKLEESQADG